MSIAYIKILRTLALTAVVAAVAATLPMQAQSAEEDLGDNNVCLDCHIDEEQVGSLEVGGAQVHNPDDNSLIQEAHNEVACIDCHMDIEEIPHRELSQRTVDCLACHESTPK